MTKILCYLAKTPQFSEQVSFQVLLVYIFISFQMLEVRGSVLMITDDWEARSVPALKIDYFSLGEILDLLLENNNLTSIYYFFPCKT